MGEITIPIKEEVYKALLMEKKDKESLSEVILRLSKKICA
ncbi:MAG: antitoxin VapB family protein [Candidatus Methanospirareceae archaeon]